ncbi:MAG: transposase family protein [Clostridiales bacterium]|jgi:transposase|nr:transposase family protein [Clostridiales bacterium]
MVTVSEFVQIVLEITAAEAAVSINDENKTVHLEVETIREGLTCPHCGAQNIPVYDTRPRRWRHIDVGKYKSYIHYRQPRCTCPHCGVVSVPPPWAPKQCSHFTNAFELEVMKLAKSTSVLQIAIHFGENDPTIWGIIKRRADDAMASMNFQDVRRIGVDETSSRKGLG